MGGKAARAPVKLHEVVSNESEDASEKGLVSPQTSPSSGWSSTPGLKGAPEDGDRHHFQLLLLDSSACAPLHPHLMMHLHPFLSGELFSLIPVFFLPFFPAPPAKGGLIYCFLHCWLCFCKILLMRIVLIIFLWHNLVRWRKRYSNFYCLCLYLIRSFLFVLYGSRFVFLLFLTL